MTHQEWQTKFTEVFSVIDDPWHLEIVSNLQQENGWLETRYKGKAKFECSTPTCQNKWTSANGGAIFRYRRSTGSNNGYVKLLLGGQKCRRCNDGFEDAKWDGVYIEGALEKLLRKVKQKCYSLRDSASSTVGNQYIQANRTAPHQTHLCQLCQQGICPYNRQDMESIVSQIGDLDVDDYSDYDQYHDYDDYDYPSDSW